MDKAISDFLPRFEFTLNTIPGVNDITVAKLLSEIGDIRGFSNADKLANFAGVAPVKFSSSSLQFKWFSYRLKDCRGIQFLCLLSKAVGKRQEQTTGIDSDLQTVSQYYLWNAEKQNGIQDAGSAKNRN